MGGGEGLELWEVEGAGAGVEPEHADQQKGGRDKGVKEELNGGAAAVLGAAEGADHQRHGNERKLPEAVVEEEIEGHEDAEHGDLLEEKEGEEEAGAGANGVPAD